MFITRSFQTGVLLLFLQFSASAATHYVSTVGGHVAPFLSWTDAATNVQSAIDVCTDGEEVLVADGVYGSGGKAMSGTLTNRVALDKAITLRSVNGPWNTVIQGGGATNGNAAVRCAWLTNGAVLEGFMLRAGATRVSGDATLVRGGGVWSASSNAVVVNCVIRSNVAAQYGGGAYGGTLNNCLISSNSSLFSGGGGAADAILNNCTIVGNSTGIYQTTPNASKATNCVIYFNTQGNVTGPAVPMYNCCATPMPSGSGNFTNAPQLFLDGVQLSSASACRGAGLPVASGTDIFGRAWATPPSVGCSEWAAAPQVLSPTMRLNSDPVGFSILAFGANGDGPMDYRWLKDGVFLENSAHFTGTDTTNLSVVGVQPEDFGGYQIVASNAWGMATSGVAQVIIHYVDAASANPQTPFTNWMTAATTIQDAIDVAAPGEIVLVTNGIYVSGGKVMGGNLTNRVVVDKAILVQSVNGSAVTTIQGAPDSSVWTNGLAAVRCVWMTNNAILSGFEITRGATRSVSGSVNQQMFGGGVWANSTNATVANCVIATNMASYQGGGAYQIRLLNSEIRGNLAVGSGTPATGVATAGSGGGAVNSLLRNCLVTGNQALQGNAGGTLNCFQQNCAFTGNSTHLSGAAAHSGKLVNCTVADNISWGYSSTFGAVTSSALTNCIVYRNQLYSFSGASNCANCVLEYCCTTPLPSGNGNIDADPQLLIDGIHLAESSPCRSAGNSNLLVGTDIDGQPWSQPPSMGCDEWQPEPVFIGSPKLQITGTFPLGVNICGLATAGKAPFAFVWKRDGNALPDGGRFHLDGSGNLLIDQLGPQDAGSYQLIGSNEFGAATSAVVTVTIHCVDAAATQPVAPFTTWATAATNIQDAIDAASTGAIVLVTNGIYATGGKIVSGDLINRIAIDKPLTVASVNGYKATTIRGAWDPVSTNGPLAIRGVWLTNGAAMLAGFTVEGGATRASGMSTELSGGGIWCADEIPVATVINCLIRSNAAANSGGGIYSGVIRNSIISGNSSLLHGGGGSYGEAFNCLIKENSALVDGGGYYYPNRIRSCTVVRNRAGRGGGLYVGGYATPVRNCIVYFNSDFFSPNSRYANYDSLPIYSALFANSCITPLVWPNQGNIDADPQFTDDFHLAVTSPCRAAGSAANSSGTDLDGEAWQNPPSMGCDQVVEANIVGPLSVGLSTFYPKAVVGHFFQLHGSLDGRATRLAWDFGDGSQLTNSSFIGYSHAWTNAGSYNVTFMAYNSDHPEGVSTGKTIEVVPLAAPNIIANSTGTGLNLKFSTQPGLVYAIEQATNMVPPVTWSHVGYAYSTNDFFELFIPGATNSAGFY
ncbi:MAG TPA: PKD domain-containing protein, partial [Candidatus Paceibacterota bacterium]|nr:PKD domain-containing protein [Candidatus Paceibacterota bacterium]